MSTQIFISWSGDLSHTVAALLHEWIPTVLQTAEPFLSSTDIEKGSRWSDHVAKKLEECGFGIIVLTKNNLTAPWILFEAGALSKMVGRGQVSSLLIGVDVVDVKQPLSQFQNTIFSRDDCFKLISSINKTASAPLRDDVLLRTFGALWPDLEASVLKAIEDAGNSEPIEAAIDEVSDMSSIKSSLGELIQSVKNLRDEMKNPARGIDIGDLTRQIRWAAQTHSRIPRGLIDDINMVHNSIERRREISGESTSVQDDTMEEWLDRLRRVSRYLDRDVSYRSKASGTGDRWLAVAKDDGTSTEDE